MSTTYSLQRALDKVNLLDNKIESALNELRLFPVIAMTIGNKTVRGYQSTEDFATKAESRLQSVESLIKQRDKLKAAIIHANATTELSVGGEVMSIAAAIERRTSIQNRKNLLNNLRASYQSTVSKFEQQEDAYREGLNKHLEAVYGKEAKTKHDTDSDMFKPYRDENQPRLIDPLGLKDRIDELTTQIQEFDNEVKFALTEANVRTDITVED